MKSDVSKQNLSLIKKRSKIAWFVFYQVVCFVRANNLQLIQYVAFRLSCTTIHKNQNQLEEKLGEWKPELEDNDDIDDPEEVSEPPAKLTATEMLRKQMREEEKRAGMGGSAVFSNSAASTATVSSFRKECQSYEALPDTASDIDQLDWWRNHQEQFPLLSYCVRVVFAVPVQWPAARARGCSV